MNRDLILAGGSADPAGEIRRDQFRRDQLSLPALASAVLGVVGGGLGAAVPWRESPVRLAKASRRPGPGPDLVEALAATVGPSQRIALLRGPAAAEQALEAAVIAWTRRTGRSLLVVAQEPDYAWSGLHPLDRAAVEYPDVEVALCDELLLQAGAELFWCPDRAALAPEDRWLPAALTTAATWGADLLLVGVAPAPGRRWSPAEAAQGVLARSLLDPEHTRGCLDSDAVFVAAADADRRRYPPDFPRTVRRCAAATATTGLQARAEIMAHTVEREWRDRSGAAAPAVRAPWLHLGRAHLGRIPNGHRAARRAASAGRTIAPHDLRRCRLVGLLRQEFPPLSADSRLGIALESAEQWLRFAGTDATAAVA